MNRHPVSFDNLVDWVDERLDEGSTELVRAHLETGCTECHSDLAWLRRVIEAAKSDNMVEPPAGAVVRAKQLYRERSRAVSWKRLVLPQVRHWAPAMAVLLLLLLATAYLSQMPLLMPGQARLSGPLGIAQVRGTADVEWQVAEAGDVLGQGDTLRVGEASAVLSLFDGTRLTLQPGAEVSLETLRSGLFGASYHIALQQRSGSVEYDVAQLRGGRCHFEAQTPTVLVTVQGTRFVITVETVEETRVTVLQGSVRLDSAEQSTVLVEREGALVPVSAPMVRLPTLTATFTPLPIQSQTAPVSLEPSRTPLATHTPTPVVEEAAPSQVLVDTLTTVPSVMPTVTATIAITETQTVTQALETSTPDARSTVSPDRVEFTGVIEAFPLQVLGTWRIGGREVVVRPATRIRGTPAVGLVARVECLVSAESSPGRQVCVAVLIDIAEVQPRPGEGPTSTPWWGAVTTLLPPSVQTVLPQLPTLALPTSIFPPGLVGTMVAWPTEHPIQLPWPSRTSGPRATPEVSPTPGYGVDAAPTATPSSVSMSGQ
jgi:hypothetical protein